MKQLRFDTMKHLRPPKPTIRTPEIAERIARRIVRTVNLDDFYWTQPEIEDRIFDVQQEITRAGHPATVFGRLWRQQQPISDSGERGAHPYGWEGIDEHCRHIADDIAAEELASAVKAWDERYL